MKRFLFFFTLVACSRTSPTASLVEASAPPVPDAAPAEPKTYSTHDGGFVLAKVPPFEARRSRVGHLPADLGEHFIKHFLTDAGGLPTQFDLQTTNLTAAGRRAVLAMEANKPTSDARPLLIIADESNNVVWSRRPIGGIMPPVGPIAIAAAPSGRVALAACDPPTDLVALRIFDDDGSPFADFQVISNVGACESLSLVYWQGHGWIIGVSRVGSTLALVVKENGSPRWAKPIEVGARSRAGFVAPANLAADDEGFVLVQVVQPSNRDGSPFHTLAWRYDVKGTALWPAAVDLGETPRKERVRITQTKPTVTVDDRL